MLVLTVARLLGPQGQGRIATAVLLPQFLLVSLNLGVGPALIFFLNQGTIGLGTALCACRRLYPGLVLGGLAGGLAVLSLARMWLFPGIPPLLLLEALLLWPVMLGRLWCVQLLQGVRAFSWYNRLLVLQPLSLFATLLLLRMFGPVAVEAVLLVMGLTQALTWFLADRVLKDNAPDLQAPPTGFLRQALAYGLPSLGTNLVEFLNLRGNLLLVNAHLGVEAAGLFKLATQIGEPLMLPTASAVTVLLPRLCDECVPPSRRRTLTILWLGRLGIAGALLAVLASVLSPWVVPPLFGKAFRGALPVVTPLLTAYVAMAVMKLVAAWLAGGGRPQLPLAISLVALTINLALNAWAIPRFGLWGAGIATAVAFTIGALLAVALLLTNRLNLPPTPPPAPGAPAPSQS